MKKKLSLRLLLEQYEVIQKSFPKSSGLHLKMNDLEVY